MTIRTRAALGAFALSALLAGCGSSVNLQEPAPVETRSTAGAVAAPAVPPSLGSATAGSRAGNAQSGVATVNLGTAAAAAAPAERIVYFDFDSFVVKDQFRPVVEGHAKALAGNRARRMVVEGHADERGSREYNLALGQKRAEAVVRSLELLGAQPGQLEAVSFGEERPAAQGSDEAAWAKNRRAELKDR
jgi:peptidoglycan-associated lipoprotein